MRIGSPEFLKLQEKWYKKAEDSGFNDLEYINFKTGTGQDDLFKRKANALLRSRLHQNSFHYYSLLTNFITHNQFYKGKGSTANFVAKLYAEGIPFRTIILKAQEEKKKFASSLHLKAIHVIVKQFVKDALKWNKEHEEGLEYPGTDEAILDMADSIALKGGQA